MTEPTTTARAENANGPVRIGNCSGFYGDRGSALAEVVRRADCDVITGDYLAEVTMLVLTKDRARDPDAGYARSFVRQIEPVLGDLAESGTKVVVNAGGLNPAGLAQRVAELRDAVGVDLSIARVGGDDLRGRMDELAAIGQRFPHLTTGAPLSEWRSEPVTVNAYLGGWGIARALAEGADIVICPRVTDASMVVGTAAWWHDWPIDAWDQLAGAVVAGHIIECGTQATGGNYSGFAEIEDLRRPGFPVAEVAADGTSVITKLPDTGGGVTVGTCTEQLLYEIQGLSYLNPDVTTHLDSVELSHVGPDRIRASGTTGAPPPPTTKVSITGIGGYQNNATFALTGLDTDRKAGLARSALEHLLGDREGIDELRSEVIGVAADDPTDQAAATSQLRVAVRGEESAVGRAFFDAVVELALSNYPGLYLLGGTSRTARSVGTYWPALVDQSALDQVVVTDGRTLGVAAPPTTPTDPTRGADAAGGVAPGAGATERAALGCVAGARSGDKGGNANVGLWTRTRAAYDWLAATLTSQLLQELLPEARELQVERYLLPNLNAVNFIIHGLLDGGATETMRFDGQAKALGEYVRAKHLDIPVALLDERIR